MRLAVLLDKFHWKGDVLRELHRRGCRIVGAACAEYRGCSISMHPVGVYALYGFEGLSYRISSLDHVEGHAFAILRSIDEALDGKPAT